MIATGIAEKAGIKRVIVPHMAAVFSAFGIGFSNLAHEYRIPLAASDIARVGTLTDQMLEQAHRDMYGEGIDRNECSFDFALLTTEGGQIVAHPFTDANLKALASVDGLTLSLKASFPLPMITMDSKEEQAQTPLVESGRIPIRTGPETVADVPVYWAKEFSPGRTAHGPSLIRDDYLTCFIKHGWSLRVNGNKDLILEEITK